MVGLARTSAVFCWWMLVQPPGSQGLRFSSIPWRCPKTLLPYSASSSKSTGFPLSSQSWRPSQLLISMLIGQGWMHTNHAFPAHCLVPSHIGSCVEKMKKFINRLLTFVYNSLPVSTIVLCVGALGWVSDFIYFSLELWENILFKIIWRWRLHGRTSWNILSCVRAPAGISPNVAGWELEN